MSDPSSAVDYRDPGWILKIGGAALLLIGLAAAAIGPLEIGTFYSFSEGGRFHYDGFGFGSFMFAYIAVQVAGYYVIAALGISLGIGHLRLRRWALALSEALIGVWLIAGLPLTLLAVFMLITSKPLSTPALLISGLAFLVVYPVGPLALGWFYRRPAIRRTFEADDAPESWFECLPLPVRVLGLLLVLTMVLLHFPLLTNGTYPWFGVLLSGKAGINALDATILLLGVIVWGVARRDRWAWWAVLILFAALALSSGLTFSRVTVADTLQAMAFPPYELDLFSGVPFLGWRPALAALLLPLVVLVYAAFTHRYFGRKSPD